MSVTGIGVVLFGLLVLALAARSVLRAVPPRGPARVVHFLLGGTFAYGCVGFYAQAAAAAGGLSFLPSSIEWPVLWPEANVLDSTGNTVLGLASSDRIQVYDRQGRFVRGWFVAASGGAFKVRIAPSDHIEVFAVRGQRRLVYTITGELVESGTFAPRRFAEYATQGRPGARVMAPWPLWPLAHPFVALALFAVGGLGTELSAWRGKRRSRSTEGGGKSRDEWR